MQHARYNYRGVIMGWDPSCAASEAWCRRMGVDRLAGGGARMRGGRRSSAGLGSPASPERAQPCPHAAGGRAQPFYHVLVHLEEGHAAQSTYVAQQNIVLQPLPPPRRAGAWLPASAAALDGGGGGAACHAPAHLHGALLCAHTPVPPPPLADYELHPDVGRYFNRLAPDGARYELNAWMRHRFPDD